MQHAAALLCSAGLRVTISETGAPQTPHSPNPTLTAGQTLRGLVRTDRAVVSTGTEPSADTPVPRGALVKLNLRAVAGIEEAIRLPPGCQAQATTDQPAAGLRVPLH